MHKLSVLLHRPRRPRGLGKSVYAHTRHPQPILAREVGLQGGSARFFVPVSKRLCACCRSPIAVGVTSAYGPGGSLEGERIVVTSSSAAAPFLLKDPRSAYGNVDAHAKLLMSQPLGDGFRARELMLATEM